jgi:hypothetical protein
VSLLSVRDPGWHRTRAYVCAADVDITDCRLGSAPRQRVEPADAVP